MALLEAAQHVNQNEHNTVGFYISQDMSDPSVFTKYERFASKSAMEAHNGASGVRIFFDKAKPSLDGEIILVKSTKVSKRS